MKFLFRSDPPPTHTHISEVLSLAQTRQRTGEAGVTGWGSPAGTTLPGHCHWYVDYSQVGPLSVLMGVRGTPNRGRNRGPVFLPRTLSVWPFGLRDIKNHTTLICP